METQNQVKNFQKNSCAKMFLAEPHKKSGHAENL